MAGVNHHGSRRAVLWVSHHRWRNKHRRRSHVHRPVRIMMPKRDAEAHTRARLRRSGERHNCNCTNKE